MLHENMISSGNIALKEHPFRVLVNKGAPS